MAEEKIVLGTIDINANEFLKTAKQAKAEIDRLTQAQKDLRKSGDTSSQAFVENDIQLKNLRQTYRQSTQAAAALESATKDLTEATNFEAKSVQDVTNERAKFIKLSKTIRGNSAAEIEQRNKLNKIIDQQTEFIRENSSSYVDNKDRVGEYRDAINSTILSNTKLGAIISQGIDIYEQSKASIEKVTAATKAQKAANEGLGGANKIVSNSIISVNGALKLFRLALISTGIGAIVVALGSLIAFLATTQEGIDAVNSVLMPMKEIFSGLLSVLQNVGKAMFDAISNPRKAWEDLQTSLKNGYEFIKSNVIKPLIASFENFVLRFQSGILKARVAWNEFTNDADEANKLQKKLDEVNADIEANNETIRQGAKNIEKAFSDAGAAATKFFNEQIDRGSRLAELDIQIAEGKNELILKEQELRTEIKRANKEAEDTTKTLAEREAAAQRSITASEQLLAAQQAILDKEIERAELAATANDTSREDQAAINELIAQRGALEEQALELQTTQTNKLNTIRNQVDAERKKAQQEFVALKNKEFEADQKRLQEELDLYITQQGIKDSTLMQEVETAREVARQKEEILEAQFENGKISETKYQSELLKIRQEFIAKETALAVSEAQKQLDLQRQEIDSTIINEQEKLARKAEAERVFQEQRREAGAISEMEYNSLIDQINEEERIRKKELEAEREAIDKENRLAAEQLNFEERVERERQRLEQLRHVEVEQAEKTGASVALVNAKFDKLETDFEAETAKQKQQIAETLANQKVNIAASTLNSLSNILGKESKAGKAVAIAQSLINTYQGITSALRLPFPANIAAAASTATVGFKSVMDISSTKTPAVPKAERGMFIKGKSHSQGGQMIEAEAGEVIVNKRSTSMFAPLLSAINQAGGGVPFAAKGMRVGSRDISGNFGATPRNTDIFINYKRLGESVAMGVSRLPSPVVAISEIREADRGYTEVIERANI